MKLLPINKTSKNVDTILILPEKATISLPSVLNNYITPLGEFKDRVLVVGVFVQEKGALKKSIAMEELEEIYALIETYGIDKVMVANADYYKFILQAKKKPAFEREIGSFREITWSDLEVKVIPTINHLVLNFQPNKKSLLQKSLSLLSDLYNGVEIQDKEEYVNSLDIKLYTKPDEVKKALKEVFKCGYLACDIETSGLHWYNDELLTISFSKDETSGFAIALHEVYSPYGKENLKVVKSFIENYKGKFIFHNGNFDVAFLVRHFFMSGLNDIEGMYDGINHFDYDDTMLLAYLCLNSVDRPKLGLKDLAFSKYGNWDKDVEQSNLINQLFEEVGKYNVVDTCATFYLFNKYSKLVVEEEQEDFYFHYYRKLAPTMLKMQMAGIPIDRNKLENLGEELRKIYKENLDKLRELDSVKETIYILKEKEMKKKNAQLKTKQLTTDDINLEFNPKSTNHLRILLFDVLGLEVIDTTETGNPATGKDVIAKMLMMYNDEDSEEFKVLSALNEISQIKNILSTFVEGFLKKIVVDEDGRWRLFGSFKLHGTISARMAASDNLLNMPSGSAYGKEFKKCLIPFHKNGLIGQIDADQLEDRVIANTANDRAKKDIFLKGLDSHSYNAFSYYKDKMPDIVEAYENAETEEERIKVINNIKEKYPNLRQDGKPITFQLAYLASPKGVANNLKIPESQAEQMWEAYWDTYKGIKKFVEATEKEMNEKGYVIGQSGLKLRVGNYSAISDKSKKNSILRSAFNMKTQSSARFISEAVIDFTKWIENNGLVGRVIPIANIYDSLYCSLATDITKEEIYKINKNITRLFNRCPDEWEVKLGSEFGLGKTWVEEFTLSNSATLEEIEEVLNKLS